MNCTDPMPCAMMNRRSRQPEKRDSYRRGMLSESLSYFVYVVISRVRFRRNAIGYDIALGWTAVEGIVIPSIAGLARFG